MNLKTLLLFLLTTPLTYNTDGLRIENKELRRYTLEYLEYLDVYGIEYNRQQIINVRFNALIGFGISGLSYGMNDDSYVLVFVNPTYWEKMDDNQKRWLIYHELTHDIFNLPHYCTPIMEPVAPRRDQANDNIDLKIRDLFLTIKRKTQKK